MTDEPRVSRTSAVRRLVAVCIRLTPLLFAFLRDRRKWLFFGGRREVDAETRRRRGRYLHDAFVDLGPTYIKLGQALSTRSDALPPEYTDELEKLQDKVPPAPWSDVVRIFREDVGEPADVFDYIERDPVNSASIGQVYRAEVDGDVLAVKVRRPDVEDVVAADLAALRVVERVSQRFLDEADSYTLTRVIDQFDDVIHEELDYGLERRSMEEIRGNFSDDEEVHIPRVQEKLSGPRVTTMEYVEGVKITDVRSLGDVEVSNVVKKLQRAYAEMVLEHGVFHADPHPGNLAVASDGSLVLYDFGAVGRLSKENRDNLFEFYDALRDEDYDRMVAAFVDMGMLPVDVDRNEVDRMFQRMREDLKEEGISGEASNMVTLVQENLRGNRVTASRELMLLFRTVATLEAVCNQLDESFDFSREAYVYVLRTRSEAVASAFERMPEAVVERIDPSTVESLKRRADDVASYFEELAGDIASADG